MSILAGAAGGLLLGACARRPSPSKHTVTLATSVDDFIARPIVAEFENQSGVSVSLLTDTEATKTAALLQRVMARRPGDGEPFADVWWSGEAIATVQMAKAGYFVPHAPAEPFEDEIVAWPETCKHPAGLWHGVGLRARVMAYHTGRVRAQAAPAALRDLLRPEWKDRIGMARPQFGTTRGAWAALVHRFGIEPVGALMAALKDHGLRIYEGNSAVVRGVAHGEITVGLTDTDDVWAGQEKGWPVAPAFEATDNDHGSALSPRTFPSIGPLLIPCTVGVFSGTRQENHARLLADFLLSARCERMLARSASANRPLRPKLAEQLSIELPRLRFPAAFNADWSGVGDVLAAADTLLNTHFPA